MNHPACNATHDNKFNMSFMALNIDFNARVLIKLDCFTYIVREREIVQEIIINLFMSSLF